MDFVEFLLWKYMSFSEEQMAILVHTFKKKSRT
jgi:hypothetical protein